MSSKDPATSGSKIVSPTENLKFSERLNDFLIAYRKFFLIFRACNYYWCGCHRNVNLDIQGCKQQSHFGHGKTRI
jgi:hypothetical protein